MKIALIGSSGTGKTTTGKLLSEHYSIPLVPEFAEEVASGMDVPLKEVHKCTLQTRYEFEYGILKRKKAFRSGLHNFISDRTELDILAYMYIDCHAVDEKLFNKMRHECERGFGNYDYWFLFDWGRVKFKDEDRRRHKFFHQKEHYLIEGLLYHYMIDFVHVPPMGELETVRYITDYVAIKSEQKRSM